MDVMKQAAGFVLWRGQRIYIQRRGCQSHSVVACSLFVFHFSTDFEFPILGSNMSVTLSSNFNVYFLCQLSFNTSLFQSLLQCLIFSESPLIIHYYKYFHSFHFPSLLLAKSATACHGLTCTEIIQWTWWMWSSGNHGHLTSLLVKSYVVKSHNRYFWHWHLWRKIMPCHSTWKLDRLHH